MDSYDYSETESDFEFVRKSLTILYDSSICILFMCLLMVMPIIMVYVGVKNLQECPKEPRVPIYLLVGGSVGLVKLAQTIWEQWRKKRKERFDQGDLDDIDGFEMADGVRPSSGLNNSSKFMDVVFSLFLIVWFGFGNYWVFNIWKPNFRQPKQHDSQNWCSKDAYMCAVIQIFACYVLGILFILITLCVLLYSKCCRVTGMNENELTAH